VPSSKSRAGGASQSGSGGGAAGAQDKPKREAILDLSKYVNEPIRVKFMGGREGEEVKLRSQRFLLTCRCSGRHAERIRPTSQPSLGRRRRTIPRRVLSAVNQFSLTKYTEPEPHTRSLGLVVLRGPLITIVSPVDGSEEIANPFMAQE
jgi:U6 snRNA-associated Sm-like protein LSm7